MCLQQTSKVCIIGQQLQQIWQHVVHVRPGSSVTQTSFSLRLVCESVGCSVVSCVVDDVAVSGADPKSVLCAFYKVGQCMKGDKCKFSHDLSIGRKAEKRSIYEDQRDASENGKQLQRILCYLSPLCYVSLQVSLQ